MVDKNTSKTAIRSRGFSLIELLVVITIITIITAGMVAVASHVQLNAKIKNTKITITILSNAHDEYKAFRGSSSTDVFPLEIRTGAALAAYLDKYFNVNDPSFYYYEAGHGNMIWDNVSDLSISEKDQLVIALSSIEFVYFCLDEVPACRDILKRLPEKTIANDDEDFVIIRGQKKMVKEVNDAWGHPIKYEYAGSVGGNFPVLLSAGPDGIFDTADDIISSEF